MLQGIRWAAPNWTPLSLHASAFDESGAFLSETNFCVVVVSPVSEMASSAGAVSGVCFSPQPLGA